MCETDSGRASVYIWFFFFGPNHFSVANFPIQKKRPTNTKTSVLFARGKAIDFQYVCTSHEWRSMHTHKHSDWLTDVQMVRCSGETVGVSQTAYERNETSCISHWQILALGYISVIFTVKIHRFNEINTPQWSCIATCRFFLLIMRPLVITNGGIIMPFKVYAQDRDTHTWDNSISLWFLIKNCQLSGINR